MARAERFGVIAIVDASKARHLAALRAMGLESRLAAEVALNVTMETLLEPDAARARLIDAARACAAAGAGAVILGCTGMAHHRAAVEDGAGVPVIEPCQAAAAIALCAVSLRCTSRQSVLGRQHGVAWPRFHLRIRLVVVAIASRSTCWIAGLALRDCGAAMPVTHQLHYAHSCDEGAPFCRL